MAVKNIKNDIAKIESSVHVVEKKQEQTKEIVESVKKEMDVMKKDISFEMGKIMSLLRQISSK